MCGMIEKFFIVYITFNLYTSEFLITAELRRIVHAAGASSLEEKRTESGGKIKLYLKWSRSGVCV